MSREKRRQDERPMTDRKRAPVTERYVHQREVLAILGISRPTLWEWRRSGLFPQPRRLGPSTMAWPIEEIREWQASRPTV